MPEVNRRYFESLMQDKELSLRALARRMSMSHSQLSLAFSGSRRLKLEEASQLASIFGRPLHEIVENAGISVRSAEGRRVSVIGSVRGDGTVALHTDGTVERTSAPQDMPEDSIAVQCRTAGSALDFMDGWIFFAPALAGIYPAILGRFALVRIKGGPTVVATVKRGYREGTHNLSGPFQQESVTLEAATPVIWTRN